MRINLRKSNGLAVSTLTLLMALAFPVSNSFASSNEGKSVV